jgi:hypothetical protein
VVLYDVAGVALQRSDVVAVGVVGVIGECDDGGATRPSAERDSARPVV